VVAPALPLAVPLLVVEPETPNPPGLTVAPVDVLAPTPAPVDVLADGVLVVPVVPVPMAVLPPTLPPVVTPVDCACAAAPAIVSAATKLMVLNMVCDSSSDEESTP
jgi:hypothetical protein